MRKIIFLAPILSVAFYCCTKTGNGSNTPGSPAPGNPAPGNTSHSITITSVSPIKYYTDEKITITGTGFNPDITKDTVDFGRSFLINNELAFVSMPNTNDKDFIVVSATTTELVIKAANPDTLYKKLFETTVVDVILDKTRGEFRVKTGGAFNASPTTGFKSIPKLESYINFNYPIYPGDSAELYINGVLSGNPCEISIYLSCSKAKGCSYADQFFNTNLYYVPTPCTCEDFGTLVYGCVANGSFQGRLVRYDSSAQIAIVDFVVPKDFFGTVYGTGNGPVIDVKTKAINSDGRSSKEALLSLASFPRRPR